MARTTFSGPVKSDNGFEGDVVGSAASFTVLRAASATFDNFVFSTSAVSDLSATVLRSSSATITNLIATTATVTDLKVGTTKLVVAANAASGAVSNQVGYLQVLVGSTTAYIALYTSVTV